MKEIIIATKNKGKAAEFQQILEPYGMTTKTLLDFADDMPDVEETGVTFTENARLKAEQISAFLQKPVIADDSGLAIDFLDGRPGVYSARYAGEPTNDVLNYEQVLKEMGDVPQEERTARFICVLAFAVPGKSTIFKKGICEGSITMEPRGSNGFGYDPIFIPKGYRMTMAELNETEKNTISHRYHALLGFQEWLHKQQI